MPKSSIPTRVIAPAVGVHTKSPGRPVGVRRARYAQVACFAALLLATMTAAPIEAQTTHTYDIFGPNFIPDLGCATPAVTVTDTFTVTDVQLALNVDHPYRGDLHVTLWSPAGTSQVLIDQKGGNLDNYDVLLTDASVNPLDDGDNDDTNPPIDRDAVPDNPLSVFDGESSNGVWFFDICDLSSGDTGHLRLRSADLGRRWRWRRWWGPDHLAVHRRLRRRRQRDLHREHHHNRRGTELQLRKDEHRPLTASGWRRLLPQRLQRSHSRHLLGRLDLGQLPDSRPRHDQLRRVVRRCAPGLQLDRSR